MSKKILDFVLWYSKQGIIIKVLLWLPAVAIFVLGVIVTVLLRQRVELPKGEAEEFLEEERSRLDSEIQAVDSEIQAVDSEISKVESDAMDMEVKHEAKIKEVSNAESFDDIDSTIDSVFGRNE